MQQLFRMRDAEGNDYDVPASDMNEFSAAVPNASRVTRHRDKAGNDYDVPDADMGEFKGAVPDAIPLRRVSFADGSTRDFTMPELSKFLRSKEWREGEQFKADREERDRIIAARNPDTEKPVEHVGGDGFWQSYGDALHDEVKDAARIGGNALSRFAKFTGWLAANARPMGTESTLSAREFRPNEPTPDINDVAAPVKLMKKSVGHAVGEGISQVTDILFPDVQKTDSTVAHAVGKVVGLGAGLAEFALTPTPILMGGHFVEGTEEAFDAAKARGATDEEAMTLGLMRGGTDAAITAAFKKAPVHRIVGALGYKPSPAVLTAIAKAGEIGVARVTRQSVATAVGKQMLANATISASEMGTLGGLQAFIDDAVMQEATKGEIDWDQCWKTFGDQAVEQAAFGAVMGLLPTPVKVREAVKQRDAMLKMSLEDPMGVLAYANVNPEAGDMLARAWRKDGKVSRRVAREAGLPEMDEASRNAVGETIAKMNDAQANFNRVIPDEIQSRALDEAIAEVGGVADWEAVRKKVLSKIGDAKELDDPKRREELVGEAFEEWYKEHKQEKPNETGNVPDEKPAQPKPPVETRAEGPEAVRPVEGEPPRGEAPRPDVVKPAEKPKEPPQGSQEPPAPPKTGEDTPRPTEGVEAASRAADANGDWTPPRPALLEKGNEKRFSDGDKVVGWRRIYNPGITTPKTEDVNGVFMGMSPEGEALIRTEKGSYVRVDPRTLKTPEEFAEDAAKNEAQNRAIAKRMTEGVIPREEIDRLLGMSPEDIAKADIKFEQPAKPVPDGKGKMVKPKAAESDYGVTMFEEPAVDGEGVSYVVKDGPSDAHRMMFKSKAEAEARLAKLRAERKAIKESPSATLADGTKVHLLKTDEGWVPYNENYIDLRRGLFNAAKTKAQAVKVAEKGVKWAKDVAEFNSAFKRFEEDFGLDEFNKKVGWGNENGEGWNESAALEHLRQFDLEKLKDMKERAKRFNLGHHNGRNEKIQEWFDKVISEKKAPVPDGKGKMVKPTPTEPIDATTDTRKILDANAVTANGERDKDPFLNKMYYDAQHNFAWKIVPGVGRNKARYHIYEPCVLRVLGNKRFGWREYILSNDGTTMREVDFKDFMTKEEAQDAFDTLIGRTSAKADAKDASAPTEPPKTTAPVVDETGKTAEVTPPDSVEAKISAMKRGSPEQLKAQKEYFEAEIAKAEKAIEGKFELVGYGKNKSWRLKGKAQATYLDKSKAPNGKDNPALPPTVKVKIPGDGEFTVPNNPDGIARLKKVAAKFKPAPKKGVVETDSIPREPSLKPAEKPKIEPAEKETAPFVTTDKTRKALMKPMSDGKYVYATDGYIAVRRPLRKGEKVKGEEGVPVDAVQKFFGSTDGRENDATFKVSVSELYPKLVQADVVSGLRSGEQKPGDIELWRGTDGKLHIRARDGYGNAYSTDADSPSSTPLTLINGRQLQDFLKLVAKSGGGEIEIGFKDPTDGKNHPLTLKGGGWEAVLSPRSSAKGLIANDLKSEARAEEEHARKVAASKRAAEAASAAPSKGKAKKPASNIQPQKPLGEPTKGEKSATIGDTIAELDPSEKPTKNNPLGQIVVPAEGSIAQSIDADIAADEAFAAKTKGRSQGSPPAPAPGSAANPNLDSGYEPKSLGAGVKSPVARQQIVDKFKELFGDTVAIRGKNTTNIGKNYAGHYEPDAGIIRSKDTASLRTIPHELGHHIDALTKRMLIPRPAAAKQELIALGRKLYGNRRPNGGYQAEGFAELLKYYLQGNDAGLLREAPEAYRWLTRTFAGRVPDTMAKIDAVRDMIDRFQNQSAEQAVRAIRAKDKSLGEKVVEEVAQLAKGLKPTQENWIDEGAFITKGMRASGIDRLFDWLASGKSGASAEMIDKVKNHPVFKWKLYNGKAGGKAFNSLNKGLFNLSGSRRYTYGDLGVPTAGHSASEVLPTFNDIFGKFSAKEMDEFQNYAIARVAKEAYLDRGLEFGLAAEEIAPVLRKHANNAKFRDALDRYTHYKHGVLHLLVDAGAMSQQQFEAIVAENPIYVKIARRRENAVDLFRDAMLKRKGKAVNKRTGSNRQIEDIFDTGLIDDERVIKAAFQADILRSLVDAGKRAEAAGGVEAGYSIGANWIHEVPNSQGEVKFAAEKLRKQVVDALRNAGATGANGETGGDLFDALFGQNATLSVFKEKASNGKSGLVSLYDESGKLHTYELPENNAEGWAKALMGFTDRTAPNVVEKWFQIATAATRSGATLLNPYFAARNLVRDSMHAAAVNDVGIFIPGVSSVEGLVHDWLNTNPKQIYDAMNLGMGTMLGEAKLASAHKANRYLMSRNWFEAQWRKGITKAVADVIGVTENASRIKAFKNAYDAMIKMGADHEAASIIAGCNALDITLDFQRGGGVARKINRAIPFFNAGIQGLEKFARAHGIVKPKEWSFQRSRTKIAARTIAQELATITLLAIASELYNRSDDDRRRKYGELPSYEKNNYISFGDMRIPVPYESGYVFASIPRAVFEELYDGREGAVAESVAMFRKTLPGLSLDDIAGLGPFLQVSANKDWRNITIVEEHIKKSRKVYDWYTPQTSEFSKRLSKALYQLCNKDNPPEWIAPAYLDTIFNGLTGNLYGRTVGAIGGAKEFDISRPHTYPLVGTFFRNPTTSRLANDFYRKRQSLTQGFGSRELTPEENGQRLAMDEVAKELAPLWEENRMLSSRRDLSTKERNDQIEANTFKALDAIRNFNDRNKASDRKSGIAAAAGALTASAEISKDVRSKNLAVLKGISYEEAAAALKAYGREKMQTPVRNSRGFKTGRMKTHPRWTNETIQKRLRILRRVMDENGD